MSLESIIKTAWDASPIVTGLVTGGLWRDEEHELNEDGTEVEMPFARFSVVSESVAAVETKPATGQRQCLEEHLIQLDIFATDPSIAKRARDAAKDVLDGLEPTLTPPEIFISIDRTNAFLIQDEDENDGATVWHAGLEYVVTVQRSKNG